MALALSWDSAKCATPDPSALVELEFPGLLATTRHRRPAGSASEDDELEDSGRDDMDLSELDHDPFEEDYVDEDDYDDDDYEGIACEEDDDFDEDADFDDDFDD